MEQNTATLPRPRIAVLANIYRTNLHTQHILDRILDGYGFGNVYHHSLLDVVSLYVDSAAKAT